MKRLWDMFFQSVVGGTVLGIIAGGCVLFLWGFLGLFPTGTGEFDSPGTLQAKYLPSLPIPYAHLDDPRDFNGVSAFPSRLLFGTVNPAAAGKSQRDRAQRGSSAWAVPV